MPPAGPFSSGYSTWNGDDPVDSGQAPLSLNETQRKTECERFFAPLKPTPAAFSPSAAADSRHNFNIHFHHNPDQGLTSSHRRLYGLKGH